MGFSDFDLLQGIGVGFYLFSLAFGIFMIVCMWKVYEKAGYPGVGAIIPIYNVYVEVKMGGFSGWALLLFFIPVVNVIFAFVLLFKIAENFGKGGGFALGLIFLSPIFWAILAFDDSVFQG
ncbi:hypothetical protein KQ51_00920 [Candidatus Izimaplasma bacterium HR1]|jgi:hypothetical protein|uniref:DUF5684 domain-containing protein n=1 Tax=Candidatus Izimoplasma sp. HR1 TaxID=1541959 RepID=UPI0004F6F332|nr:hypothetical protein KQ51_00920 [Candidatus Izimaplasma bacterium HR1]